MADRKKIAAPTSEELLEFHRAGLIGRVVRKLQEGDLIGSALRLSNRKVRRLARRFQTADLHYGFDAERVLTKRYADTFENIGAHHVAHGNYYLDSRHPLNQDSVVYSLGVGGDVSFDRSIAENFGAPVYLYDPTPASIGFMELLRLREPDSRVLDLLKFFPIGAWSEDTVLRFDMTPLGGSASAVEEVGKNRTDYFEARCETVKTMMRNNGHDHIDVLKMDIEGAAEGVMDSVLAEKIFPTQIVAEFERPRRDIKKLVNYFAHVETLCDQMRGAGYGITHLPRSRANYFGLELLFVRRP